MASAIAFAAANLESKIKYGNKQFRETNFHSAPAKETNFIRVTKNALFYHLAGKRKAISIVIFLPMKTLSQTVYVL